MWITGRLASTQTRNSPPAVPDLDASLLEVQGLHKLNRSHEGLGLIWMHTRPNFSSFPYLRPGIGLRKVKPFCPVQTLAARSPFHIGIGSFSSFPGVLQVTLLTATR